MPFFNNHRVASPGFQGEKLEIGRLCNDLRDQLKRVHRLNFTVTYRCGWFSIQQGRMSPPHLNLRRKQVVVEINRLNTVKVEGDEQTSCFDEL